MSSQFFSPFHENILYKNKKTKCGHSVITNHMEIFHITISNLSCLRRLKLYLSILNASTYIHPCRKDFNGWKLGKTKVFFLPNVTQLMVLWRNQDRGGTVVSGLGGRGWGSTDNGGWKDKVGGDDKSLYIFKRVF